MKKYILRYGVIGGLVSSLLGTLNWLLVAQTVGVGASQAVGYASIAFSLLCIPLGVRYFRDQENQGQVNFGQAFRIGLSITVIAGVVMAIHSVLFFAFQKEAFMEWQRKDLNPAELATFDEQLAQMPDFAFTPWFQGMVMFFMVFLIGLVINLISAMLLKRDRS